MKTVVDLVNVEGGRENLYVHISKSCFASTAGHNHMDTRQSYKAGIDPIGRS